MVVAMFMTVSNGLKKIGLTTLMMAPLQGTFAAAYQYGHPKALGYDNGGPVNHPRATDAGANNFRIFLNPRKTN